MLVRESMLGLWPVSEIKSQGGKERRKVMPETGLRSQKGWQSQQNLTVTLG